MTRQAFPLWVPITGWVLLAGCGVFMFIAPDLFDVQSPTWSTGLAGGGGGLIGGAIAGAVRLFSERRKRSQVPADSEPQ